ncbi:ABC transporter ATP-binding protein [Pseudomonas putida]|uniref:dipeptide ABC transporter ATP-binding protein n=1 Tax=Pseudomonas putida TaxID=303 RepID=UPI0023638414|nr:ABC transporter ATP-binding protein [Pseudomonas putida]MDD1964643.1 ABC transporter ATP-binding protein [Pseudomonas putida]
MSQSHLLDVRDLSVSYRSKGLVTQAVRGLSFTLQRGETVAIVGESGSGKSTLANALLGLLPVAASIDQGELRVGDVEMRNASERQKRLIRGRTIGLVPQDPMVSLNPTLRVGQQIGEALKLANGRGYRSADAGVVELLGLVGLDNAVLRARQYPHELSGGMRQRVLIAIAMAGNPQLIIADEPTSALDVTVQRKILDHLQRLVAERGISLLIITHDLGVATDRADRLLVMKQGELVEQGTPRQILDTPQHPYTRALLAAAPAFSTASRRFPVKPGRPILSLQGVGKTFELPGLKGQGRQFAALEGLSFDLSAGQTLAIVGESGSGKSTTLRIALGLEQPTRGRVLFEGQDVTGLSWKAFRPLRRRIQLVQQNPFSALDPRFTVFDCIVEPLVSFGLLKGAALEQAAVELMGRVQLPVHFLDRLPHELSGGQRQRVAIARALALNPDVLLLDEPVSALDVSVQAQILDLLDELQRESNIAYVLVSHDLAVVARMADQVLVLRQGRVVEQGALRQVFERPTSEYTRELLAAIPGVGGRMATPAQVLKVAV